MSRRIFAEAVTANVTVTTTTEEPVVTKQLSGIKQGQGLVLIGFINVLTGVAASQIVLRIRELTGIAGTLVGEAITVDTGAAGAVQKTYMIVVLTQAFQDEPFYTLNVDQVDATGNATVQIGALIALKED